MLPPGLELALFLDSSQVVYYACVSPAHGNGTRVPGIFSVSVAEDVQEMSGDNTTVLASQSQTVSWSSPIHNQSSLRFIICGWAYWTFPAAWHHRTESGPDERPSSPLCTEPCQSRAGPKPVYSIRSCLRSESLQKGSCRLRGRVQICVATLAFHPSCWHPAYKDVVAACRRSSTRMWSNGTFQPKARALRMRTLKD